MARRILRPMVDDRTYTNPVYPGYFADPFVLFHEGTYYAYGTDPRNDGDRQFEVLQSADLVSWRSLGYALARVDDAEARDYWAPEVAVRDGRFYLYYSAGIEDTGHRIRVAVASRPDGPFEDAGRVLTAEEPFAIDPHPFQDDDGRWYLYYAHDVLEGERPGTSIAVDELVDPFTLAGRPRHVVRASADWQLFRRQRPMYGAVYDWYTLEGPTVRKRDGRYWCLYSGGAWTDPTYGVSFAVADSPLGPFREERVDRPALLGTVPGHVIGPGHNSVVEGPDGRDWIVYHAWDPDMTARRMCIDRLDWTPDGPRTDGPTFTPQPVPAAPVPAG
jgi:beta-xylosidase